MAFAQQRLNEYGVTYRCMPLACNLPLALEDASVDVIASLYSLEHLYTLHSYLDDFKRLPKSESCLMGTIPVEGGLAWGGGAMLISRRWLKNKTTIHPYKIICWE